MNDLRLKPFCVVCHGLCSYFSLSFCGFLLCALTSHFIPATSPFWALQYPISRRPPQPSKPVHTSHLYPAIPLFTTHTYILYIHTTHASILFCIHFFLSRCISLVSSLVPSRFVLHSLFPFCSDRFALILFVFCFTCSRIVSFLSALALVTSSICALSLSLYLSFTQLFHSGIYRHTSYYTELRMQRLCDVYGVVVKDRII